MTTCDERSQNVATESCIKKLGELQITATVCTINPEKWYGFFSYTNARDSGAAQYKTPGGGVVDVTEVKRGVDIDIVKELDGRQVEFVGEVTDYMSDSSYRYENDDWDTYQSWW